MWCACVGVYQLFNWKMQGETLKFGSYLVEALRMFGYNDVN